MEIEKGFKIDNPNVFIPWNITENELIEILDGNELKNVTNGYYGMSCESLNGLKCYIGFHFNPRKNGILNELEFFRNGTDSQIKSFDKFQFHFEREFGKATKISKGKEGFENYEWWINGIQIVHFVFDRFGPEEHMRIRNKVRTHNSVFKKMLKGMFK